MSKVRSYPKTGFDPVCSGVASRFSDRFSAITERNNTMIEQLTGLPAHAIGFKMSGKLHDEDYKKFVPLVDAEIAKEGKVNVLAQFNDFHGWDAKALWDDIKFSTTHCTKMKRIA